MTTTEVVLGLDKYLIQHGQCSKKSLDGERPEDGEHTCCIKEQPTTKEHYFYLIRRSHDNSIEYEIISPSKTATELLYKAINQCKPDIRILSVEELVKSLDNYLIQKGQCSKKYWMVHNHKMVNIHVLLVVINFI